MAIHKHRVADARGKRRGVLWSDAPAWYSGSGLVFLPGGPDRWAYFHFNTRMPRDSGLGFINTDAVRGQHRAWSDGSVEWIRAEFMDLRLPSRDETATYKFGAGGTYFGYLWF